MCGKKAFWRGESLAGAGLFETLFGCPGRCSFTFDCFFFLFFFFTGTWFSMIKYADPFQPCHSFFDEHSWNSHLVSSKRGQLEENLEENNFTRKPYKRLRLALALGLVRKSFTDRPVYVVRSKRIITFSFLRVRDALRTHHFAFAGMFFCRCTCVGKRYILIYV